jgi:hypothetical protein
MSIESLKPKIERTPESEKEIFDRVTEHSRKFDKEIAITPFYTPEAIKEPWQVREWKIDDTTIKAIGVMHVPETFLEYRDQIEKGIEESDVIVNEFAPEALGYYDKTMAEQLKSVKSKYNENYNLEQLRQAYIKFERPYNIGVFHHEIELLAAKYGKDMAVIDPDVIKCPEGLDEYLYASAAEEIKKKKVTLGRLGLFTGAGSLAVASLINFFEKLSSSKKISRRTFLKTSLMAGAASAMAAATPKIIEAPPETSYKKYKEIDEKSGSDKLTTLRDPKIAESLQRLSEMGYKKITFIYGAGHLNSVEKYLKNPNEARKKLAENKEIIERNNPDSFRIYSLSPGKNTSEKFVASEDIIWKRKNK